MRERGIELREGPDWNEREGGWNEREGVGGWEGGIEMRRPQSVKTNDGGSYLKTDVCLV